MPNLKIPEPTTQSAEHAHGSNTAPAPWVSPIETDNGYKVWGREHVHNDNFFPIQIRSEGTSLFSRPMTLQYQPSGGVLVTADIEITRSEPYRDGYRIEGFYQDEHITIDAEQTLEFDGFQRFDLEFRPNTDVTIDRLEVHVHFNNNAAHSYSKFLEYDFSKQNVVPGSDNSATGTITEHMEFHFNPTIWIGRGGIGVELIHETNIHFSVAQPESTHSISKNDTETTLVTRVIDRPMRLANPLPYSFALLATPTKPKNKELQGKTLTSRLPNQKRISNGACCEDQIYIGHWKRTPLDKPGLPNPSTAREELNTYKAHRKRLDESGLPYVAYSALYMLPANLHVFKENPTWKSAPSRKGSAHWSKKLNMKKPVQPVSYHDTEFRKFIINTHLNAQQKHDIDGIYFDVATMREVPTVTSSMAKQHGIKPVRTSVYYPLYGHRELLKEYWIQLKAQQSDFLIVHHGASIPRISYPFIDILVFGEPFHRQFSSTDSTVPGNPGYVPDYFGIDPKFIPNRKQTHHGPSLALLPLVKRRNDDYLESYPQQYRKWTRSAIAISFLNNFLLWNTRIEPNTWETYWGVVQKFGGLGDARHEAVETNSKTTNAAIYIREKAILLMIANQSDTDTTINLDKLYFPAELTKSSLTEFHFAESGKKAESNNINIPARDYILLLSYLN